MRVVIEFDDHLSHEEVKILYDRCIDAFNELGNSGKFRFTISTEGVCYD